MYVPLARAQQADFFESTDRVFYGGIVGGANASGILGDAYSGYHKVGLSGGLTAYVRFSKSFSASLELGYTQKGSRGVRVYESVYVGTAIEKYYADLNYMEVPLVLHYTLYPRIQLGAGASYAQLINSKEDLIIDQPIFINQNLYPYSKTDVCYILSGTYQLYNSFLFNVRYQRSVVPIRNANLIPTGYIAGDQVNSLFSFRFIYLF